MAVERAYEGARHADISLSPSIELALERKGDNYWGYYFADHDRRVIFWFEDYQSHGLLHSVRGVKRKSHVSESSTYSFRGFSHCVAHLLVYALESQYWFVQPRNFDSSLHDLRTIILTGNTLNYFQTNVAFQRMLS
jgi:hypothetical protein